MPKVRLTFDESSAIALKALAFLAASETRLERFLALSGIAPHSLAAEARNPAFLDGVLAHLLSDEPMLLEFCANEGLPLDAPARARAVLCGSR
jgi:hypothetical protein